MKYMQNGSFQQNPMMRMTLLLTLLFLSGFIVVNFLIFFSRMDLNPHSIATYFLGNEEEFHPARSYQSMIETTHSHLPIMAVVILLLTHLVIFTPFSKAGKYLFIFVTFLSALTNEGSNYMIRFVHPAFAWLKIAAFVSLQVSLIFLVVTLTVFLIKIHLRTRQEFEDLLEVQ